jgi:hypothetical protein
MTQQALLLHRMAYQNLTVMQTLVWLFYISLRIPASFLKDEQGLDVVRCFEDKLGTSLVWLRGACNDRITH